MKKPLIILSLLLACGILQQCVTQKKVAESKAAQAKSPGDYYDIPDHVTETNRRLLIEKCEKGKILYKLHCGDCHGIFVKSKEGVPDFTNIQIDNYHMTALIGMDPVNHAVAKKMSPEQIDQVVTFLRLRKVEGR